MHGQLPPSIVFIKDTDWRNLKSDINNMSHRRKKRRKEKKEQKSETLSSNYKTKSIM